MKISTKIIVIVAGFALVAASLGGLASYFISRMVLESSIADRQVQTAEHLLDDIDRFLYGGYLDIVGISKSVEVENISEGESVDSARVRQMLSDISYTSGPWDLVVIANTKGKIITSDRELGLSPTALDKNWMGLSMYEKALEGENAYSDLILTHETGKPNIVFASPIRSTRQQGRPVIGVVMGYLSWGSVLELLGGPDPVKTRILNAKGLEIGSNDQESLKGIFVNDYSRIEPYKKATTSQSGSGIMSGFTDRSPYLTSYVHEGGRLDYKGHGWTLFIETPISQIYQSMVGPILAITGMIIVLIFAGSLAFWIAINRTITKPLEILSKGVEEIADGNLTKKINVKERDEIGLLANAFNSMSAKLAELYTNLEKKVEERTKELSQKTTELSQKAKELEEMNRLMIGRELKMVELKKELEALQRTSSTDSK